MIPRLVRLALTPMPRLHAARMRLVYMGTTLSRDKQTQRVRQHCQCTRGTRHYVSLSPDLHRRFGVGGVQVVKCRTTLSMHAWHVPLRVTAPDSHRRYGLRGVHAVRRVLVIMGCPCPPVNGRAASRPVGHGASGPQAPSTSPGLPGGTGRHRRSTSGPPQPQRRPHTGAPHTIPAGLRLAPHPAPHAVGAPAAVAALAPGAAPGRQ